MHKQRIALLITSIVGIVATFLTWLKGVPILGDLTGLSEGVNGWITLVLFALVLLLVLIRGKKDEPIKLVGVMILNVLALLYGVAKWALETSAEDYAALGLTPPTTGLGLILVIVAALAGIILAVSLKGSKK